MRKRQLTQTQLAVVLGFYLIVVLGTSIAIWRQDRAQLARYDAIAARGVRTEGTVDGTRRLSGKTTTYLIDYSFQANGRTYRKSSPVTYDDYAHAEAGRPIGVIYVPDTPDLAMAANSTGRADLQRRASVPFLLTGFAVLGSMVSVWSNRRRGRQRVIVR